MQLHPAPAAPRAFASCSGGAVSGTVSTLRAELEGLHQAAFAWALRCCDGRRDEAEDVLQRTYLKVLAGAARFAGRSTLKTWLFGVIRKTAAEARRRRLTRAVLLLRLGAELRRTGDANALPAPDLAHQRRQQAALVRRALESLSPRQRQVLHLVFFEELSLAEAADVLGLGIGSVRTHYARAKTLLRRALEEERKS